MTDEPDMTSLILRDRLAIDRTVLANERTLLAYMRTAMTMLITGLSLMKFFPEWIYQILSYFFLVASGVIFFIGFLRYHQFKKELSQSSVEADVT